MLYRNSVRGLTGENGRVGEWDKATQTSSPIWYPHALGLEVFCRHICSTPPDTEHGWGTHKFPTQLV